MKSRAFASSRQELSQTQKVVADYHEKAGTAATPMTK